MSKKILWVECSYEEKEVEQTNDEYSESQSGTIPFRLFQQNIVNTPFGPMNLDDPMSPAHDTKFYIVHTNFDFTKSMVQALAKCEGIEYLAPVSRYRFAVGFGVLFDVPTTVEKIEEILGVEKEGKVLSEEMSGIISDIKLKMEQKDRWVAYVFPNGEFIVKEASSEEDYTRLINDTANLYKESMGVMVNKDEIYF